jgi:hypothetical protein
VGPNASGKTTFFDVVGFIGRLLRDGLESACRNVSSDPRDLTFGRRGGQFSLAVEASVPSRLRSRGDRPWIRYEISISVDPESARPSISAEQVQLVATRHDSELEGEPDLFPDMRPVPQRLTRRAGTLKKAVVSKNPDTGKDNFYP